MSSLLTAILQAVMAYLRSAGSRKPVDGSEAPAAPTLAGPSPGAVLTHPSASSVSTEDSAAAFAAPFEGFSPRPYLDPAGVWTIGYGSTLDKAGNKVTANTPDVTEPDALLLMARDMDSAVAEIERDVKVPLSEHQEVALADFIYNLGAGNFRSSTLLKKLNAKDYAGAAAEFDKWDHAGGKVLAGLLKRREAERKLFETA